MTTFDWKMNEFREPRLSRNLCLVELLREIGNRHGLGGFPRAVAAGGGVGKAGVAHGMILPFRLRSSADVRCFPGPRERWGWKGRSVFAGTRNATKLTASAISSVVLGGSRFREREGAKLLGPLGAASAAICCASDASADAARRRLAARLPLASVGL